MYLNLSKNIFNNHILDRHGPNSIYGNKSHLNTDFDIKSGIDSTLKGDNFIIKSNTTGRDGYIFEQIFINPIGTNSKGKSLYTMKVVIDVLENVVSAFTYIGNSMNEIKKQGYNVEVSDELIDFIHKLNDEASFDMC